MDVIRNKHLDENWQESDPRQITIQKKMPNEQWTHNNKKSIEST